MGLDLRSSRELQVVEGLILFIQAQAEPNRSMSQNSPVSRAQIALFFAAVICFAASMGINDSIFNNFLSDTFNPSATVRGWLEFPREFPGFAVVVMAGILWYLPVTKLGFVGSSLLVVGLVSLGIFGTSWNPMLLGMMIASAGHHLMVPVSSSIALATCNSSNRGFRLGILRATMTLGLILGAGLVWLVFDTTNPQYRLGFFCAAFAAAVAGIIYGMMHIPRLHRSRAKFVIRRKYSLYYGLELLFGARKQIFLTFGMWVLIRIYEQPASAIAALLVSASLIGLGFKPLAGLAIDRFGERAVLVVDAAILAAVCIGYGYAGHIAGPDAALTIVKVCFISDNLLFSMGAARTTYLSRLTDSHEEIISTLAMGVSINHIASMLIPAVAGYIWVVYGFERVFLGAACLAVVIAGVSFLVPRKADRNSLN